MLGGVLRLWCSFWVGRSVRGVGVGGGGGIHERLKSRQGVREQNNILLASVFLHQVLSGSFQGMEFCSVVGAQATGWDGEGEGGSIWTADVGTTASILKAFSAEPSVKAFQVLLDSSPASSPVLALSAVLEPVFPLLQGVELLF